MLSWFKWLMSLTGAQDHESPGKGRMARPWSHGQGGDFPGKAEPEGEHTWAPTLAGVGGHKGGCGHVERLEDTIYSLVSRSSREKVLEGPPWKALERAVPCEFRSLVLLKTGSEHP